MYDYYTIRRERERSRDRKREKRSYMNNVLYHFCWYCYYAHVNIIYTSIPFYNNNKKEKWKGKETEHSFRLLFFIFYHTMIPFLKNACYQKMIMINIYIKSLSTQRRGRKKKRRIRVKPKYLPFFVVWWGGELMCQLFIGCTDFVMYFRKT